MFPGSRLLSMSKSLFPFVGPLMFLMGNFMILLECYLFLVQLLPSITVIYSASYYVHFCILGYFLVNVMFNYYSCAFSSPGSPPRSVDPERILGRMLSVVDGKSMYVPRNRLDIAPTISYRYCKVCHCIRPPRAHHCNVTGKCVL